MTTMMTAADIRKIGDEPRVLDERLSELLGFDRARAIRQIIRRNAEELLSHGALATRSVVHEGAGRPTKAYYLNEAQTILICMFSRTKAAAEVRTQIVQVFMAWRRGEALRHVPQPEKPQLALVDKNNDTWRLAATRARQIDTLTGLKKLLESDDFARASAHMPNILYLDRGDGQRRVQRRPIWWHDLPVRQMVFSLHRQCTIDQARALMIEQFGKHRVPSRSSLGRAWHQFDLITAVA